MAEPSNKDEAEPALICRRKRSRLILAMSAGESGGEGEMAGVEVAAEDVCFHTILYAHQSSSIHPV